MLHFIFKNIRKLPESFKNSFIFQSTSFTLWYWDIKRNKYYVHLKNNDYFDFSFAEEKEDLEFFKSLLHPEDKTKYISYAEEQIKSSSLEYENTYRIFSPKKQAYIWIKSVGIIKRDKQGRAVRITGSQTDITETKLLEEKLIKTAYYDELTGLPNYENFKLYFEELSNEIKDRSSLLYIDIKNFNMINSVYGYGSGDVILKEVGKKIKKFFSEGTRVCRYHSDKFLVLVTEHKSDEQLEKELEDLYSSIHDMNILGFKEIQISLHVGIAKYKKDAICFSDLLRSADIALNVGKTHKKRVYEFYDISMLKEIIHKTNIVNQLDSGFADEEFYMVYQPIVDCNNMKILGVEALIRWENSRYGNIPPNKFIDIAESSGQIMKLECWIVENVFSNFYKFEFLRDEGSFISINLSTKGLINHEIEEFVISLSERFRVDLKKIQFEITETVLMEDINEKIIILNKIKDLGCSIALDDFGSGFSSLNYLDKLPVQKIKLDKELIDNVENSEKTRALCRNLIKLAHNLNLKIIAEGVEDKGQLEILKNMDCDSIQGYFYSKPVSIQEINKLI